jgi:hypothetical protein
MNVLHVTYYLRDQIEKNAVGGSCSIYGGEERRIHDFDGKT